jgi:hypothetical protein
MLIHTIISWHVQMMMMNGFGLVIWPMWVILGQICGRGVTKISWCDLPNFLATILPDNIHRANQFHIHPYHHLLICSEHDNECVWVGHLAHVSYAGSDLWPGRDNKISWCDLPNFSAKILSEYIDRANHQLHAHPCYHLLICPDNNNQLFGVGHLAHVSHAGSDLLSGCDKNQLMWFAQFFSQNPIRRHP